MKQASVEKHAGDEAQFEATDRFDILALVGRGAAGLVYEAFDRERNSRVALKTLHAPSPETILLLKNEFRGVHDLRHPNLVTLHELFEHNGRWFYTMDFVRGGDFLAYVRRSPGAQEQRLRDALGQLAHGLCALHGANKVHRDIKPSNVLVSDEGHVVILDFGILSTIEDVAGEDSAVVGTAHYMAPEQITGEASTAAADWYAFGVMLYQALTGHLPFVGPASEVLERKLNETPRAPSQLTPGVPRDLEELCMALLRTESGERPSGADVLARLAWTREVQPAMVTTQTSVFVGRREEMAQLQRAFADVRMGDNVTVLVHGESGVGKSFLVRQFTEQLRSDPNVKVFRSRCYERESVAYKAVDGIIDGLCVFLRSLPGADVRPLLPPHAALLCRVFPVLEQVDAIVATRSEADDAMAKLYATEAAQRVVDRAVQSLGGLGVTVGSATERLYREVRALRIYEGTSEIQKLVIARELFGA